MANKILLRFYLYMIETPQNVRMVSEMKHILEEKLGDKFVLEVIDVLSDPEIAEKQNIFATPTLIKDAPPPPKRIMGDFSSGEKVLRALELI